MILDKGKPTREGLAAGLVVLVDVQPLGEADYFRGSRKPGGVGRVYGGQVVAQALAAATKTVAQDRLVHSLHAYFLRGGSEDYEIDYQVDRDFDGGSFSNRRVIARQNGQVIFNLAASFHIAEKGHFHQPSMPDVPPPEDCETIRDYIERSPDALPEDVRRIFLRPSPIEMRCVDAPPFVRGEGMEPRITLWFKAVAPLDVAQWMHRALVAYASDFALIGAAARPHDIADIQGASIDHSLWFHQQAEVDEWMLYSLEGPWAGQGRGLGMGRIFDRSGRLVASVAQEGLMRDKAKFG